MPVDKVDNSKFVTTAILATAATGATTSVIGYNRPVFDDKGLPKDVFVKNVATKLENNDKKTFATLSKVLDEVNELPETKTYQDVIKELYSETGTPNTKEINKALADDKKAVRFQLREFLIKNNEILGIKPKENQSVEQAVDKFLSFKRTDDLKGNISKALNESIENLRIGKSDYKAGAKEYINLVYDSKAKDFKKATEEIPQTAIDYIKNAMKDVRNKAALKYGAIGVAATALVSLGSYITLNNKKD
ncbi:MAG: hypothetical protein LKG27_06635 [Clostridiaceae bacterium]|jgi:hypothetical protein|nr:hypothetical protein [Clostridiaceae bacterium]